MTFPGRRRPGGRVRRGDDAGASAIELSIVAPGLILLIFFAIQAGLFFYGQTVAIQAAREGVSQLRLAPDETTAAQVMPGVEAACEGFARAVGREALLDPVADAEYDAVAGRVSVTVSGRVITLVPGLDLWVRQQAFGEVERFEGDL